MVRNPLCASQTCTWPLFFISHVNADLSCTVPNGSTGQLIPLEQCENLNDMNKSRIYSRIQYLRESLYGHTAVDRPVYVCCPHGNASEVEPNATIIRGRGTLPDHQVCGKHFSNRIVGGRETRLGEHPWAAQIIYRKHTKRGFLITHLYGGSLIDSRYVLTAAHCFTTQGWTPIHNHNPDCVIDMFGHVNCAPAHIDIDIEKLVPHPNYRSGNDIALIRLARPVTFTDFVKPICLPIENSLRSRNHVGEMMEVVGWGKTETTTSSKRKLKASVPVVSSAACNPTGGVNWRSNFFCARGEVGIDSCSGDSGGPLIGLGHTNGNGAFLYLAGIVSFGTDPCGTGWPGVYTNVFSYIDWIEENLEQ